MNDHKARLLAAQKMLTEALDNEDHEQLPTILAQREADLVTLVESLGDDQELRSWTRSYLERDREIMARTTIARDAVARKLSEVRRSRSVHRIYISEGLRR